MKFYQARQARRGKPGYRMKIASLSSVIVGALKTHLAGVRRTGPASWSCASEAAPAGLTASLQSDWLVLEVRTDGRQREEPCGELLAWNACFAPPAKWVQLPGGGARLRAEVPLEPAERLPEAIEAACTALLEAAALSSGRDSYPPTAAQETDELNVTLDSALRENIRHLCEEWGWRFHRRPSGRTFIDLDAPGESYQAQLAAAPDGQGASLFVELVPALADLAPAGRIAVAAALLGCGGGIRGVRPVARGLEGGAAGLECTLSPRPDGRELGSALSCLSVACEACGRELSILQEEAIARQYLLIQGLNAPETREVVRASRD